jgi:hypothetical protein
VRIEELSSIEMTNQNTTAPLYYGTLGGRRVIFEKIPTPEIHVANNATLKCWRISCLAGFFIFLAGTIVWAACSNHGNERCGNRINMAGQISSGLGLGLIGFSTITCFILTCLKGIRVYEQI